MSRSGSIYFYNFICPVCGFNSDAKSERHLKLIGRLHCKKTGCKLTHGMNHLDPIKLKQEKRTIINFNDLDALALQKVNKEWTEEQKVLYELMVKN